MTSGKKLKLPPPPVMPPCDHGFAGPPFSGVVGAVPSTPELDELLREFLPPSVLPRPAPLPASSIDELLGLDLSLSPIRKPAQEAGVDDGTGAGYWDEGSEVFESLPALEFFFASPESPEASDELVPTVTKSESPGSFGDIFELEKELVRMMEAGEGELGEPVSSVPVPFEVKLKAAEQVQRVLLSTGLKPRKRKSPVPATKKTDFYFDKRRRNNLSAAKNRAKERGVRTAKMAQHQAAVKKNAVLRLQVIVLEQTLSALQAGAGAFEHSAFSETPTSL